MDDDHDEIVDMFSELSVHWDDTLQCLPEFSDGKKRYDGTVSAEEPSDVFGSLDELELEGA